MADLLHQQEKLRPYKDDSIIMKLVQRKGIIDILLREDWVSTDKMKRIAAQYNARIFELRQEGFMILSKKKNGRFGYTLLR